MTSHDSAPRSGRRKPASQSKPIPAKSGSAATSGRSTVSRSSSRPDKVKSSATGTLSAPRRRDLSPSELWLINGLNAGSNSALAEVYRRFRQRLLRFVKRNLGPHLLGGMDAEEFTDSAIGSMVRIVKVGNQDGKKPHFEHPGASWNWLLTVAIHKIIKRRKRIREERLPPGFEPVVEVAPEIATEVIQEVVDELTPSQLDKMVELLLQLGYSLQQIHEKAIKDLAPPGPEIFELKVAGRSRKAIAERLGCTVARVRTNLERMLERLKKWLAADLRG